MEVEGIPTPEGQAPPAPSNEGMPQPGTAPDTSVAQAPPAVPAAVPAPPAAPQPVEPPVATFEEVQQLRRQHAEAQRQLVEVQRQRETAETQARIGQEVSQYRASLEADGLSPQQAQAVAQREYQLRLRGHQAESQVADIASAAHRKFDAVVSLLEKHKLLKPSEKAMLKTAWNYAEPEAMEHWAAMQGQNVNRDAEVAALKAELAAVKRGQVPAQNFESGNGGGGSSSHEAYKQALKEGKPLPSSQEIDRIVAQAMQRG